MKQTTRLMQLLITIALAIISQAPLYADTVTVSIGEVEFDGYPTSVTVPVMVNNPSNTVGGIQFDITGSPDIVDLTTVSGTGNASGFTASFTTYSNGTNRILFYNGTGISPIPANSDTVLLLIYDASSIASSVIELPISNLVVTDSAGVALPSVGVDGKIEIGNVVSFSMDSDSGDITDLVTLHISMVNDGAVGGFQFDLVDEPEYLTLDSVWLATRTENFTLSTSNQSNGTRFIIYNSGNNNVAAGSGEVLNVRFRIDSLAYVGEVEVQIENPVASDSIGGSYWISEATSGSVNVWPGYLDRPHSLTASSGEDAQVTLTWSIPGSGGGGGGGGGTDELPIDQGFEDGEFGNWATIQGGGTPGDATTGPNSYWHISDGNPNTGTYNAQVDWGFNIDTWLMTPSLDLSSETSVSLGFFWNSSYTWHVTNDNGDLFVKVSTDGGTTWGSYLWTFGDIGEWEDFTWYETNLDLSAYAGESNVIVGFHVVADDNGAIYMDDVTITGSDDLIAGFGTIFSARNSEPLSSELKTLALSNGNPTFPNTRETNRDLSGYNIYRSTTSPVDVSSLNFISSVGASAETYEDTDVSNGVDYHYVVTADYGDMGESGPSNEATGTPVEWVEIGIGSGEALSGHPDTLDLTINNDGGISSFGFIVADVPDKLIAVDVLTSDRTNGWIVDVAENSDGEFEVTGFSATGSLLGSGNGAVCKVVVTPFSLEALTLNLTITGAEIVDANGNEMPWSSNAGIFEIDVETQSLMLLNNYGDPGQSVSLSLLLNNTQNVHAVQFNIDDGGAGYVVGSSVNVTNATNGWQISGAIVGGTYQILLFDLSGNNGIGPGTTHLADIEFAISSFAPTGSAVIVNISDVSMTDASSVEMYVESYPASIGVGVPEAIFTITDIVTTASGKVSGYSIGLANTATVGYFEVKVIDLPNALLAIDVQPTTRLSGGTTGSGSIGPGSGEIETGDAYIWGYFNSGGIAPGTGAIADVTVYVDETSGYFGSAMLMITHTAATNESQQVLYSMGMGQSSVALATDTETNVIPKTFSLHQNYPNPFNPATIVSYDLPKASDVRLTVYDMMGRQVKVLIQGHESAGRKQVAWNGTDEKGRAVSAGVYLYRINTGYHSATRKMLLMK